MGIRENALVNLKTFYDNYYEHGRKIGYDIASWNDPDQEFNEDIIRVLKYMVEKGWITVDWTGPKHCPATIELTQAGIDQVESPDKSTSNHAVINVANNHGVVAQEAHNFTINNGLTIDHLKELINERLANHPDLPLAQEIPGVLTQPLKTGILSRFGDLLSRHSWLSSAVAQTVLQILVKGVSNPPPL